VGYIVNPSEPLFLPSSLISVMVSQVFSITPRWARWRWLNFEAVFCFNHESVSYLADQLSIVATTYGSIVVDVSIVTTSLLKGKVSS